MKILIVGGGAAGFFAALSCREFNPAAKIIIAEKSRHLLSKVRVSGGGRCNVTNRPAPISDFAANYPRGRQLMRKILHHFGPADIIHWFESRGVQLKTEPDGRVFPVSDDSQSIINCLVSEADKASIEIRLLTTFVDLEQNADGTGRRFAVRWGSGTIEFFDAVIVACGGFTNSRSYEWLSDLGIDFIQPVPSLFTFNCPGNSICELMGVSVPEARVKIQGTKFTESGPLLITHWGFSGPAILRLSAWAARDLFAADYNFDVTINWLPHLHSDDVRDLLFDLRNNKQKHSVTSKSQFELPFRLWSHHVSQSGISGPKRWADLSNKELYALISELTSQTHAIRGKTTFKEEFVTAGGIQLSNFDHQTMQSKSTPGLFFAGEFIDIDGITGGFNFQNAWTTGYLAGKHAARLGNPVDPK